MIRNVVCLRLQRGWSKLIRIIFVSSKQEMIMVYWQQVMKTRKEFVKAIMRNFLTQSLHGMGIECPMQIQLSMSSLNRQIHGQRPCQ